jgi:hypothetical protein
VTTATFKLLRTSACLAAGVVAVAVIVLAAAGSAFLAAALALRAVAGTARSRDMGRTIPARTAPRPLPAPRAETAT